MRQCLAEFIGTAILILLGNGVVANVVLSKTKGSGAGWIVITAGWAFAVFSAVVCTAEVSGAHLNPAVTVGLVANGQFKGSIVLALGYVLAQGVGAFCGAIAVFIFYQDHFRATDDTDLKRACFCTSPAIWNLPINLISEALGTMVLMLAVLSFAPPSLPGDSENVKMGLGSIGAIQVALIVFSVGLSLGGTTGYAINPARDLGPRLAYALLPLSGKKDTQWGYAAIPVVGPVLGALVAVALFRIMNG